MQPDKSRHALALYITAGFGHLKPAIALLEQLRPYNINTESWDIFADQSGESQTPKSSLYNFITTHPRLLPFWNFITRHDLIGPALLKPIHWFDLATNQDIALRLKKRLRQQPNTLIFTTHFTPANIASAILPHHPIFLYTTDVHIHALWTINRKNLIYLVPTLATKKDLIHYGVPSARIHLASFPIHPTLLKNQSQRFKNRLHKLKKPSTIDILIISGGAGTGKIQMQNLLKTFAAPAHSHHVSLTFLVSTLQLRQALKQARIDEGLSKEAITINTYKPDNLYKAMKKAEVLITKAGGDITFEALAEGLPIYTLKDVGDHERLNRLYLQSLGASRPLETTIYPWELIHHDILTANILKMAKAANKAGQFHRHSNLPQILFRKMRWKISP